MGIAEDRPACSTDTTLVLLIVQVLGKGLKDLPRDKIIVSTKVWALLKACRATAEPLAPPHQQQQQQDSSNNQSNRRGAVFCPSCMQQKQSQAISTWMTISSAVVVRPLLRKAVGK